MIYLDNAANSHPKPPRVYEAVNRILKNGSANLGHSGHRIDAEAERIVLETRESVAKLFGILHSERIIFTFNATGALNLALQGLLEPGDHCLTSTMEHNSVVRPLHFLSQYGVKVEKIRATPKGVLDPAHFERAIKGQTKLIVLTHASNVIGTITSIAEIIQVAHRSGVAVLLDASQTAGSVPIDVNSLHLDLLACPGHKGLCGPQGVGLLYIAPHLSPKPLLFGGGKSDHEDMPEFLPDRYEAGTLNTPGIAGLAAGVEFLLGIGVEAIRNHEVMLCARLLEGLTHISGAKIYGLKDSNKRSSVVLFNLDGLDPATVGDRLDSDFGIAARVGLHCAPDAHKTIGTYPTGGVRISPGYFNNVEEIDRTLDALSIIAKHGRRSHIHSVPHPVHGESLRGMGHV